MGYKAKIICYNYYVKIYRAHLPVGVGAFFYEVKHLGRLRLFIDELSANTFSLGRSVGGRLRC